MSQELCRLCLGSERLICTFDTRLSNAQELRMCVLLSTGVEIESTDLVTKMVCRNCLEIALKLIQFRTTALANDKALKEQIGQKYVMPLSNPEDIAKLHKGMLDGMSHINVDKSIEQISEYITENDATKTKPATESSADCKNFQKHQSTVEIQQRIQADDQQSILENKTNSPDTRVIPTERLEPEPINRQVLNGETHISVKKLFQTYPNLILTDDVQNVDVTPSLILDKSEANKYLDQLQYYTETEGENTSSLNEQYYNFSSNLECSRNVENTERNALAKLNLHRDSHKFYRTDYRSNYYVDPDYYVFKTRKRKYDDISDESCSDWDTGESDLETDELAQRTAAEMITRSSKYKFPRTSYTNSDSDSEFLGFSKANANEEVRVCEYCDKICYSRSQLRHHERTHRKCQVCHKIFRTDEALSLHLRNVCYRRIEENQPFLHIKRVDDHPLVVKQYQPAFEYFFSRMNDESYEGYGKRDENISLDENFPLYHTEENVANENVYILDIFKKFQSIQNVPVRRNKMSQTRKSDIIIKYSNQNQIILQDLFSDLLTYKVPIQMVVDQKISAHISYTTKPTQSKTMHDWTDTCAINVATQPKLLSLTSALPALHFFNPTTSVLKTVTNKNLSTIRPKVVHKNKGGSITKTVASNAVKVVSNSGTTKPVTTSVITSANQQQIHNITRILTAVTTNPQTQTYTVTKTTVNETPTHLQPNTVSIKREELSEPLNSTTVATQPNQAPMYNTNINPPRQNIIFKMPFNPSKQSNRCESSIKEEILDGINESISKHVAALEHPNNTKRPVFRFPYNTQNQHQMYQNTNQNVNSNMYSPQNIRLQTRNQYLIPVTSINSQHASNSDQNGLRNISLTNLLLLKKPGARTLNSPNLPSPSHVINGNVFFPSRNSPIPSPINSTPSPIPSKISSPINTVAPFFTSNADSLNSNSYSSNSYSASKTPLPYPPMNSYPVPENSVAYDTDPFPPMNSTNAFPSENQLSYNTNPYSPSDAYSPNGFRSNSSYSPSSFQSSDAYSSNYSQYIPPYNPMSEYGYNDGHSMHMLPPQHVNTNAGGGKVFLRVKQPWELNQK